VDPYTIKVKFKTGYAPFLDSVAQPFLSIVSPTAAEKYGKDFGNNPFGSGPFKFVEWVHGDHMEFAANPDFFMGKPLLKTIYIRVVPDENTSINLLRTHDIDWMFQASISHYPIAKSIPGVRLAWVDINGYEDVQLNVQRPYLQDLRVRRAGPRPGPAVQSGSERPPYSLATPTCSTRARASSAWCPLSACLC